ncbi:MAG TPA: SCP2 sterol-binding domain-containing protein [Anaeromyxobacteraceae bacterium]|nr:SCP2 sterol-binding domain-containing protein [Anaeromyxobacteraceae bacterium]
MRFASREWVAAVVAALNGQADLGRALDGLPEDAAAVVEVDRGFPRAAAVWGRHRGGRIAEWRMLADEDDVLELEPAYVFRAPYRVWRELLRGANPLEAALSGRVKVEGDLEALVRRTAFRYVVDAALAAVPTEFEGGR